MYKLFHTAESVVRTIRNVILKTYWKLKYGNRISIGKNLRFRKRLRINIDVNGQLKIGDNVFFNNDCSINVHKAVIIGNNNLFGENVKIYDHNHVFNDRSNRMKETFKTKEIIIGNDNWFASNVIVLSKARIGNNNVFGANTIINEEYGSNTITTIRRNQSTTAIKYK